jgi:hypothetical protein
MVTSVSYIEKSWEVGEGGESGGGGWGNLSYLSQLRNLSYLLVVENSGNNLAKMAETLTTTF